MHRVKQITVILILLLVLTLIAYGIDIYSHYQLAQDLVAQSKPFSYENNKAEQRILIVGDSTAVGTGVVDTMQSVAGRFHRDFPEAEIVNLAENGAKARDVLVQIQQAEGAFHLVVVQSGANDILYFTRADVAITATREILRHAKTLSDTVVFLTGGNLGLAPVFIPPFDQLYSYRARHILSAFQLIAEEENVIFVDLYTDFDDPSAESFEQYYATDLLHLNDAGYGVWYRYIRDAMTEAGVEIM